MHAHEPDARRDSVLEPAPAHAPSSHGIRPGVAGPAGIRSRGGPVFASADAVLALQRAAGNRAVRKALRTVSADAGRARAGRALQRAALDERCDANPPPALTNPRFLLADGTPQPTLEGVFEGPDARLRLGDPDQVAVTMVQEALADVRYDPGPADGKFGPRTSEAAKQFKRDHDLQPANYDDIGPKTMRCLNQLAVPRCDVDPNVITAAAAGPRGGLMLGFAIGGGSCIDPDPGGPCDTPSLQPNPPWSQKGRKNPDDDCTPFRYEAWAVTTWNLYMYGGWPFDPLPKAVTERCNCQAVGNAYAHYLCGHGGFLSFADDGNCISTQLATEDDKEPIDSKKPHAKLERDLIAEWERVEKEVIRQALLAGKEKVKLDFLEAMKRNVVPADSAPPTKKDVTAEVTYRKNSMAGGLLFGGGHEAGNPSPDSEYGNDTRTLTATISLTRTDNDWVDQTIEFHYLTHDALDFCPGNTLKKSADSDPQDGYWGRYKYNTLLTDLSRLEASGMARDIGFDVRYHRTTKRVAKVSSTQ